MSGIRRVRLRFIFYMMFHQTFIHFYWVTIYSYIKTRERFRSDQLLIHRVIYKIVLTIVLYNYHYNFLIFTINCRTINCRTINSHTCSIVAPLIVRYILTGHLNITIGTYLPIYSIISKNLRIRFFLAIFELPARKYSWTQVQI